MTMMQLKNQEEGEKGHNNNLNNLKYLHASKLDDQELKLYKILVKIERDIGWEKLLAIRSQLFLVERDLNGNSQAEVVEKDIIKKLEEYEIYNHSIMLDESHIIYVPGLNEISFYHVKQGGEKIIEQKLLEDYDSDESNEGKELPSFLKAEDDDEPSITFNKSGKNGDKAAYQNLRDSENNRPEKITEETEERQDSDYEEKLKKLVTKPKFLSDINIFNSTPQQFDAKSILDFNIKKKRIRSKTLDYLFISLHEDLTSLYEWQNEENNEKNILHTGEEEYREETIKSSGLVWVHRGILAERLCRVRYAERAYRKASKQGFSNYVSSRLYKMYFECGSARPALICLAEVLDEFENNGINNFNILPEWICNPIYQIISLVGFGKFKALLQELNFDEESLKSVLEDGNYWKAEGWKGYETIPEKNLRKEEVKEEKQSSRKNNERNIDIDKKQIKKQTKNQNSKKDNKLALNLDEKQETASAASSKRSKT